MPADFTAETSYRRKLALVNAGLEAVLSGRSPEPHRLHEAMRHAVFAGGGGKRLRPVMLLTLGSDLGVAEERALPAAMALELLHNYSLVHDDLPCMDDAPTRRGAPSVHAAYGYTDAVLAGDALLTLAFEVLGRAANSGLPRAGDLVVELAVAGGSVGMAGGQHADLDRTGKVAEALAGSDPAVLRIHRLKTAKLFSFAFAAPGYLALGGGQSPVAVAGDPASLPGRLRMAGEDFGLAFQVADDIRDVGEDGAAPNFAKVAGLERARRTALERIERCVEALTAIVGPQSGAVALVRAAVQEMGL